MGPENHADWSGRSRTRTSCARWSATTGRLEVDRFDEEADRAAGRLVACPTLFAWSARDDMEELYGDPLAIWRAWVDGRCRRAGSTPATTWPRRRPSRWPQALTEFLRP